MKHLDCLATSVICLGEPADLDERTRLPIARCVENAAHDRSRAAHEPAASFTAVPSPSEAGGDNTTRSPADRPLRTWRSGPTLCPSVTERRCTLSSAKTKTTPALPSTRTAAAGTSTPA